MSLLVLGLALLVGSAVLVVLLARAERASGVVGAIGGAAGCLVGLVPTVRVLLGSALPSLSTAWDVPYGSISIGLDPLSAFFLAPLFVLGGLAAVYGREYLRTYCGRKWIFLPTALLNLFVASMVVVVVARGAVLFLVAWEVMTLASYLLVTFEHEDAAVRRAGWVYLLAAHVGMACLTLLFVLLGRHSGSLDFEAFHALTAPSTRLATGSVRAGGGRIRHQGGLRPTSRLAPRRHTPRPRPTSRR